MLNIPKAAQAADIYQRKRCAGPGSLRCFVPSFHGQEENRHLLIQISSPVLGDRVIWRNLLERRCAGSRSDSSGRKTPTDGLTKSGGWSGRNSAELALWFSLYMPI
jgi:hypothetical protein